MINMRPKKKGDWMQTYTGEQLYPIDPDPKHINIVDISHSLSMQCRFNGHCNRFYSVAEHSVIVSRFCKPEYALAGLMHDAAEAYLSDVIRPIKPYLNGYQEIENRLLRMIFDKYDIGYPYPENVKDIDLRACFTEGQTLMFDAECWYDKAEPLDFVPECLCPDEAENAFWLRFNELIKN